MTKDDYTVELSEDTLGEIRGKVTGSYMKLRANVYIFTSRQMDELRLTGVTYQVLEDE
jgi:hypothetical protein